MKNKKSLIGAIVSLVLLVFLLNPQWLPVSEKTEWAMQELRKAHFLLEGNIHLTLAHVLTLLMAFCLVYLVYSLLTWILRATGKKSKRASTLTELLCGLFKYLAIIIAVVWGLAILGVNTTSVLAGVGIIGLILGFGAQSLIEDVITGFFIIFEGQYNIGDIIILDEFRGIVRNIGVRTTTIEDAGGNLKVVNNSDIRNFQNRSRYRSVALCDVGISYSTDLKKLEAMLKPALAKMFMDNQKLYLSEPVYYGVEELADSGVVLRFGVETDEANVFAAKRRLARDLKILFDEKGIEIPFPQVVVHKGDG